MNQVLVAGHICLDIIPAFKGKVTFDPGRLFEVGEAKISTGGAVSNTGQALHKLGVRTSLAGKIGKDLFGKAICEVLEKNGLGLSRGMQVSETDSSSYTVVISLSGEDRMFLHSPGCNNTFVANDVSDSAIADARLIHFGYPTLMAHMFADDGAELESLFRRAKELGATTSLDVSLPDLSSPAGQADWERILKRVLPYTDLFLPSIDELLFMLDKASFAAFQGSEIPSHEFERLSDLALDLGAKVVAVKAGARGLYLKASSILEGLGRGEPENLLEWQGVELWAPVFEVEVDGTTGAGDATIAGLLMGWLRGMSPDLAVRAAVAVGACCCEQADAVSGVKSWEEIETRLQSEWPVRELVLPEEWSFNGTTFRKETR